MSLSLTEEIHLNAQADKASGGQSMSLIQDPITASITALLSQYGTGMSLACTIGNKHVSWHAIETYVDFNSIDRTTTSRQRSGFGLTPKLALADCLLQEMRVRVMMQVNEASV
jgi:hypothetical protein